MIEGQLYIYTIVVDEPTFSTMFTSYSEAYVPLTPTGKWRLVTTRTRINELQLQVIRKGKEPEWVSEDRLVFGYPERTVEFDCRAEAVTTSER